MFEKVTVKQKARAKAVLHSRDIETSYRWFYLRHGLYSEKNKTANKQKRPSVCICLIRNKRTARGGIGLAICSFTQNPSRKQGRGIALERAERAFIDVFGATSMPIARDEAIHAMACTEMPMKPFLCKGITSGSAYFDTLVKTIWPPREITRRKGHEESKKESTKSKQRSA